MTSLQEVRRVVQARLDKFQPAQKSWDAYLGDGNGTINDESQPFHTYVRYPAANSPATSITNTRVPAQIENLRIKVGYLPEQPTLLQVMSVVPDQRLDDAGSLALIPTHAPTHTYGGSDPVYVVWRQIGDFRLYATGGLQVTLQGGIATIAGTVTTISTQLIDLTDSVPATGARWSLISIDSTGAVNVTDGTPQTTATALTFAHIPATPSGEWRIWAIKLQASQTVIDESRLFVDTLDLRWPQNVGAGSVALSDLTAGSAQYQYLTTGASPYTAAWSSGYLNITAAKTLSATGTLTLTPSSDGLTLTVPKTGTAATGTGTAGRVAEWVTDANTLQASTLLKTGNGTLELQSASGANTFNVVGDVYVSKASPSSGVFEVGHAASSTVLQLYHGKSLIVQNILTLAGSSDSLTATVPATGTIAIGAGTLTVTSTNDVTGATHTHAITSSANPGAAASLLASTSAGYLQLVRLGVAVNPSVPLHVAGNAIIGGGGATSVIRNGLNVTVTANSNEGIELMDASDETLTIATQSSGDAILIGGEAGRLAIRPVNRNCLMATFGNYYLAFGSNSTERMRIDGSGNISTTETATFGLGLGIGGTPLTKFHANLSNATTNAIDVVATFGHRSTVGAADGFGGSANYVSNTVGNVDTLAATMSWSWVTATHASRKARAVLSVNDAGGARETLRAEASGTAAMIGFLGANAIARYSSTGDLRQALIDFGLVTTGGASPLDLNGGLLTAGSIAQATLKASGVHKSTSITYIDGTGTAGTDNTAQTVKSLTLAANTLTQVGDRLRIRAYWTGDTGSPITGSCSVGPSGSEVLVSHTTDAGGATLQLNEVWLHYIDNTHANIIENEAGALGALSAVNVAGFTWNASQVIIFTQDAIANNHTIIYALIVDVFPKGV